MSDSREQFEQAVENEWPDDYSFDFDPDGYYLDEILDRHFWAWQSSRQAIEGEPFTWAFTDVNGKAKEIADDPVHRSPQDLRIYTPLYKHPASCSEIPNSCNPASADLPEETLTAIHDTLRLVWSRELSADDGLDEIEILISPAMPDEQASVPDAKYIRALQDAFDIIQADANTEQNYGSLCRIGSVLGKMKAKRDKSQ